MPLNDVRRVKNPVM